MSGASSNCRLSLTPALSRWERAGVRENATLCLQPFTNRIIPNNANKKVEPKADLLFSLN
jgi:hypothetical protein